ncbi:inorganic diphosphatase [Kaarinaea lacus]
MSQSLLDQISDFFAHYKDLEANNWVKVGGWVCSTEARNEIVACVERFKAAPEKPCV